MRFSYFIPSHNLRAAAAGRFLFPCYCEKRLTASNSKRGGRDRDTKRGGLWIIDHTGRLKKAGATGNNPNRLTGNISG